MNSNIEGLGGHEQETVLALRKKAASLGFIRIGFSLPEIPPFFDAFVAWISGKRYGDMDWIARRTELRENPSRLLKGCKTVISLAFPYSATIPVTPDGLRAARYTEGLALDYHDRLRRLCKIFAQHISELFPGSRHRVCIDSAPILERSFAYAGGLGFIGKNTMLIIPGHGSYVFLAEILTTAEIPFLPVVPLESQCGDCTRCIEACPTGALEAPYLHDARRCLSYLTIEYKGLLNDKVAKAMGHCFFGCDVCQEVCPFNEDKGRKEVILPPAQDLLRSSEEEFDKLFGKTAFARAGFWKIRENVRAIFSE